MHTQDMEKVSTPIEMVWLCPKCDERNETYTHIRTPFSCPSCGTTWKGLMETSPQEPICPFCRKAKLYKQKDINEKMMIGLTGIVFLFLLYMSFRSPIWALIGLLILLLIDFILYRSMPYVLICYGCGTHFRGIEQTEAYPVFDLLTYDIWKNRPSTLSEHSNTYKEQT